MEISARFLSFTTYGVQWVLWLLIGLSVLSITVMLERLWYFAIYHPTAPVLAQQIRRLLRSGPALREGAPESARAEALDAACEGAKARERLRLERNLAFLGTLGSNAPFIGLFGTVLGIIKAFHDLAGNQAGGPAVVMAGISEALVATAVGLMVAIPAVVGYNYFNRRIRTSMTEVDWMAHLALVEVKAADAEAALNPEAAAAEKVEREPVGRGLSAAAWSRRMLPLGAVGALLLVFGGVWIGRSTIGSSSAGVAASSGPPSKPLPTTPAAVPPMAPIASSSPPIYTPPSPSPSVAAGPATPGSVAAAAPAALPAAGAPTAAPPAAPVQAVPAPTPAGPVAAAPLAPAVAQPAAPPVAVPPAATLPTAVQSSPVPPATAPTTAAKSAAHPGPLWRKGPKQWKGKKGGRPLGAGKPAAKGPEASGSGAAPDKVEESPAKAPESAPAAPAVP